MAKKLAWFVLVSIISFPVLAAETIHHDIRVIVEPTANKLTVNNTLTMPQGIPKKFVFALHEDLVLEKTESHLALQSLGRAKFGDVSVVRYVITLPDNQKTFTLNYSGRVFHPLDSSGEEYARAMNASPGLISTEGVFLAHSSAWYPLLENSPALSFKLDVKLPAGWSVVSQGDRLLTQQTDAGSQVVWQELTPQEEIYLIAAQFSEYSKTTGAVEAMAFLRQPDASLAQRYLDVTAQYIEMYRQLIGPYPYSKFALVENFWETGFGMPSFTLLGPQVIRLPFILHTSYPHEILHNWWGNSVYVDYSQGNWAEGLTAYLADHLIQEQKGKGTEARRAVLQNYTDFVSEQKEFPLSEFRSRHSASSEAIGYGKTQMMFHMLRLKIGEQAFIKGLHRLYQRYKFKEAGYDDLQEVFSGAANMDLSAFFRQWVERVGSPELTTQGMQVLQEGDRWVLTFELKQNQSGDVYDLTVPVVISMQGVSLAYQQRLTMNEKMQSYRLELSAKPLRIDIDPEFDIFRRLDRAEIPAALSQAFGAEAGLIVLPSDASPDMLAAYQHLAQSWQQNQASQLRVVKDDELQSLPDDVAVWLLGWNNRFSDSFVTQMPGHIHLEDEQSIRLQGELFDMTKHAVVAVGRNERNPAQAVVLVAAHDAAAVPGLARKLPHYRKYSYLAFEGAEPANVAKGQWAVLASPMSTVLSDGHVAATLQQRQALIELPTLVDTEQMMKDVEAIADVALAGRGLATSELDEAASRIVQMFQEAGLQPGNVANASYLQQWTQAVDGISGDVKLQNVIGFIPGANPKYDGESVIVTAHYDHLGLGWPVAREEFKGQLHQGADDNASGVAVMVSLARALANAKPERSVVFVAFTGEEAGRLGSIHYVNNAMPFSIEKMMGVVNLDTVGRLGDSPVTVFGSGSATEWVHIFRGIGFVTGIDIKPIANDLGSSDHKSFLDVGVPAVQLFASVHADFHTPRDTLDKLDPAGMVKVLMVLRETVDYLSTRPESLTSTLTTSLAKPAVSHAQPVQARKVSLGTVPDFAYQEQGVKLSDVVADSPAARAGMRQNDVIIEANGQRIESLQDYARILRTLSPGDKVTVTYVRDGVKKQISLNAVER